jgi:dimethylaniline monooxygenase (N-oxide forming)
VSPVPLALRKARRIAVVGAGGSGIAVATALQRAGLDFEVLEARDGVGGSWRYDPEGGGSACYASLVANTSKLRMQILGRKIGGPLWQYASHSEMLGYLESIADREGLRPHLRLGWRVTAANHADGAWTLRSANGEARQYRELICALGVNGRPRWASLTGDFAGEQLHSAAYRTPERFTDRDVVVIGLGTSGMEIAGEVAEHARSVVVAVRTPMWAMTRRLARFPIDWVANPTLERVLPWSLRRRTIAGLCTLTTGGLRRHGLQRPTRRCGDDIIAISDTFPRAVRRGLIDIRPAIDRIEGDQVHFTDGSTTRADVIVHATGFEPPTEFLPDHARPDAHPLYHRIVHTAAPDLYFVGLIEAHRALLQISEAQAAWTADVLSGRTQLPAVAEQVAIAKEEARERSRNFGDRRPFFVDTARYIASLQRERPRRRAIAA